MTRTRIILLAALLPVVVFMPAMSRAALFEQLATCPTGADMGNARTAYPPGAMAVLYNPAALANIPGTRFDNAIGYLDWTREISLKQAIDPQTGKPWAPFGGWFNQGIDPLDGAKDTQESGNLIIPYIDLSIPYLITPGMAISHKPSDPNFSRWTFGFAQYAMYAGGFRNAGKDPMSLLGEEAFFMRMSFLTPAVAYRLSDTLSVGMAVGLGPSLFMMESRMRMPNDMVALTGALGESTEGLEIPVVSELTLPPPWFNGGMTAYATHGHFKFFLEDYFTTSYNLGILWEPYEWAGFGVCYQSETETNMEGDYQFDYGPELRRQIDWLGRSPLTIITAAMFDLPTKSVPHQKGTATFNLTWPQRLQAGVKIQPIKQLVLTCDAHWTDWEVQKEWRITFDQQIHPFRLGRLLGYRYGADTLVMAHHFKNTVHLSYGLEVKPVKKLALRLGYEPRKTSVRDTLFGPVPFPDFKIISAGIGIVVDDKPKPSPKNMKEFEKQINHANEIEIHVSYIKFDDKTVRNNTSKNLNSTTFTDIVYNPYAGLDWHQEMHMWWFAVNQVFRW